MTNCNRCGASCDVGGVYTPQSGMLCHGCFNTKEWKEIQREANGRALPAKMLLGVSLTFLLIKTVEFMVFLWRLL